MSTIDSISKTSVQLLLKEPFYGHFMMGLPKEVSTNVPTAAVALMNRQAIKLMVNEGFWQKLNKDHRYGLIKHEVLHIVLQHLFSMKAYSNKQLFNIAADIVVNQYIERKQLPEGGILLEQFHYLEFQYGIKLERDQDVGYYYRMLDRVLKQQPKMSFGAACQKVLGKGNDTPQIKITVILEEESPELERHKFWGQMEELSERERKLAEQQANRVIKQTADRVRHKYRNFGNLPAGLAEKLKGILENMQPSFNWRRVLRLFATSSNSTYLKNTIRRPSRRYGTVPGIKLKRRNRLLLAIDTSGSIQQDELLAFFSEIYFIWKQGAEIRIVECDTAIHKTYDYRGSPPDSVHGRGGTAFHAPIEYGNTSYLPDALIYFTDGYASVPQVTARFPILWVISSNGLKENEGVWDTLPGRKLKISH